jgi:hypothetical protein
MAEIVVALINGSTVLRDAEVRAAVGPLQTQVRRDFAPAWGITAHLAFVGKGKRPPAGAWWLAVLDDSDAAGALGYHDLTDAGLPLGKIFAGSDRRAGDRWTVTASHELLEMLADPDINLAAITEGRDGTLTVYAYEICDPCEADRLGYSIDGVLVSDFVHPAWFESFRRSGGARFDQRGRIKRPFQVLPGGYLSVYRAPPGSGWTQVTAQPGRAAYASRPRVGSRRERRRTPRHLWVRSAVTGRGRA